MTTFQATAHEFYKAFAQRERHESDEGGRDVRFWCLADGSPEWMRDAIQSAHFDGRLPDDWIYEQCRAIAEALTEHESADEARDSWSDIAGGQLDIYTHDLLAWLASNGANLACCDEALGEGKIDGEASMSDRIVSGQHYALESIVLALVNAIEAQAEARDNDDGCYSEAQ